MQTISFTVPSNPTALTLIPANLTLLDLIQVLKTLMPSSVEERAEFVSGITLLEVEEINACLYHPLRQYFCCLEQLHYEICDHLAGGFDDETSLQLGLDVVESLQEVSGTQYLVAA